jgi:YidC/Oxa1 family membrane protein insertase
MMGGCLPLLIQMPILIALYQAIQKPLTYMFNVDHKNLTEEIITRVEGLKEAVVAAGHNIGNLSQMSVEQLMQQAQIQISDWAGKIEGVTSDWFINFNFLGMDISRKPSEALNYLGDIGNNLSIVLLLLIPVFAVLSAIAQNKITMKLSGQNNAGNEQAQSMSNTMMWMMPLMTGFFTFTLPAGIGLYWIVSGLLQITQQLALNYYFDKKGEDFVVKVPESKHQHRKKSKKR